MSASEQELRDFVLNLPQIVPDSVCLECRICCRFPDTQKLQTPFWSSAEAEWAKREAGGEEGWFLREESSPSLAPRLAPCGGGYRCPAFDSRANRCRIHAVKPLDCRLYPYVLTRNAAEDQVLLAVDSKCPFVAQREEDPELLAYSARLVEYLESPLGVEYLRRNPKLAGPAWPEYLWVGALPKATGWIQQQAQEPPPHPALRPVAEPDLPFLERALRARPHALSHYTLAGLLGWSDLMRFWWMPLDGGVALFARKAGGLFMPLPPLGSALSPQGIEKAWSILREANGGSPVSRIEGIEPDGRGLFEGIGFSVRREDGEYLYPAPALARLRGNGYRSQRWAINRCARSIPVRVRPFEERDLVACLKLYTRWAVRRQKTGPDEVERRLLRDGLFYHRRLLMERDRFKLTVRVLESEGKPLAYTAGGEISPQTFCVFLEIAGTQVPGLAQTLFRELCREVQERGYPWINAMGDCGLPRLRRAKEAYRPARRLGVLTASGPG